MTKLTTPEAISFAQDVKEVFGTPKGKRVLAWILRNTGMFDRVSAEGLGIRNFGVLLMELAGAYQEHNVDYLMEAYLRTDERPPKKEIVNSE